MSNFTKICPAGAALACTYADRRTERHDEVNKRFSRLKITYDLYNTPGVLLSNLNHLQELLNFVSRY